MVGFCALLALIASGNLALAQDPPPGCVDLDQALRDALKLDAADIPPRTLIQNREQSPTLLEQTFPRSKGWVETASLKDIPLSLCKGRLIAGIDLRNPTSPAMLAGVVSQVHAGADPILDIVMRYPTSKVPAVVSIPMSQFGNSRLNTRMEPYVDPDMRDIRQHINENLKSSVRWHRATHQDPFLGWQPQTGDMPKFDQQIMGYYYPAKTLKPHFILGKFKAGIRSKDGKNVWLAQIENSGGELELVTLTGAHEVHLLEDSKDDTQMVRAIQIEGGYEPPSSQPISLRQPALEFPMPEVTAPLLGKDFTVPAFTFKMDEGLDPIEQARRIIFKRLGVQLGKPLMKQEKDGHWVPVEGGFKALYKLGSNPRDRSYVVNGQTFVVKILDWRKLMPDHYFTPGAVSPQEFETAKKKAIRYCALAAQREATGPALGQHLGLKHITYNQDPELISRGIFVETKTRKGFLGPMIVKQPNILNMPTFKRVTDVVETVKKEMIYLNLLQGLPISYIPASGADPIPLGLDVKDKRPDMNDNYDNLTGALKKDNTGNPDVDIEFLELW